MMKRTWLAPALLLSGFGLLSACSTPASPVHPRVSADPLHPAWATNDALVGRVSSSEHVAMQVHLAMRNVKDAEAQLAAISDPANALYGQFLTDEEYAAKYMPTDADVAAVRAHLEQAGLTVQSIPENRTFIAVEGPASAAERAFGVRLGLYKVGDATLRAPMEKLSMPSEVSSRVLTIVGLTTPATATTRSNKIGGLRSSDVFKRIHPDATVPPNTCSEWFGKTADTVDPVYPGYPALTYAPCGYKPAQLREAYGFGSIVRGGNDGTGQTIAIVDAFLSPTLLADAQTYAANNDPDYPLGDTQLVTVLAPGTPTPPDTGWYGEQTLDVEAAHAMAPGAKIVAVAAASNSDPDFIAAENLVITKKLGSVISNSWGMRGEAGSNFVAWKAVFLQAGLKGIGVYFSSGDSGDEAGNLGSPAPDFPASSDRVTAVGGTSLALGRFGMTLWETGWETGASFLNAAVTPDMGADMAVTPATWSPAPPGFFVFGAGGGTSMVFDQPAWQKGVVPDAIANLPGAPARAVPDVAMLADPITGFIIGQTDPVSNVYGESAIGGTSLACPMFAATVLLAQQNAGHKLGFANPTFYKVRSAGFRDITPPPGPQAVALPGGIAVTFNYDLQSIHTAIGWDNVTGVGVPNGKSFLKAIK